MFRAVLPVALCLSLPAAAQELSVPGLTPESAPSCSLIEGSKDSCSRSLACVGTKGLYFDGFARGWGHGAVDGKLSDGSDCLGEWRYTRIGFARARIACTSGVTAEVIYYAQDSLTGTGIGRGADSTGRAIRIWTGENVLEFLTPKGKPGAELPCGEVGIPIS